MFHFWAAASTAVSPTLLLMPIYCSFSAPWAPRCFFIILVSPSHSYLPVLLLFQASLSSPTLLEHVSPFVPSHKTTVVLLCCHICKILPLHLPNFFLASFPPGKSLNSLFLNITRIASPLPYAKLFVILSALSLPWDFALPQTVHFWCCFYSLFCLYTLDCCKHQHRSLQFQLQCSAAGPSSSYRTNGKNCFISHCFKMH